MLLNFLPHNVSHFLCLTATLSKSFSLKPFFFIHLFSISCELIPSYSKYFLTIFPLFSSSIFSFSIIFDRFLSFRACASQPQLSSSSALKLSFFTFPSASLLSIHHCLAPSCHSSPFVSLLMWVLFQSEFHFNSFSQSAPRCRR